MVPFRPLVPLRIPSGWEVVFNNLVELPPVEALTAEERDTYLTQDLLSLRSSAPAGSPSAGHTIDVGWSPDGDASGSYRLRVVGESWSDAPIRLDSAQLEVIRDAIGLCANRLNEGASVTTIQTLLDAATRSEAL
jgi:hypothetical protein